MNKLTCYKKINRTVRLSFSAILDEFALDDLSSAEPMPFHLL